MSTFVITCGGTGGHLSPGIALAEGLTERGHTCHLIISEKQVDSRLISNYPRLKFATIPGVGFSIKPLKLAKFIFCQFKAMIQSFNILRKTKPDVVIGFGGFTTVGVSFVAFIMGCSIVLHEANRKTGKAIRLISFLARRVYLPPGVQLKSLPPKTIRHFGFPVRREIRPISREQACRRLGLDPHVKRLLVLGGSQGAMKLNQWVLRNFERLGAEGINVYCVTGLGKCSKGKLEYRTPEGELVQAIFTPFVDNMADVLASSDLVISRAGAGSIAEFCRVGIPCILVPYPFSADDHQIENARNIECRGGGIVVSEEKFDKLFDEIFSIIFNDWLLNKFHRNLLGFEVNNSLSLIVRDLEELCRQDEAVPLRKRVAA